MTFAKINFTSFTVFCFCMVSPAAGDIFLNQLSNTKKAYLGQATLNARVTQAPAPQRAPVSEKTLSKVVATSNPRPSDSEPSIRVTDFSQTGSNNRASIPSVRNGVRIIVRN